jgi:hypothetical protein
MCVQTRLPSNLNAERIKRECWDTERREKAMQR